MKKSTLENEIKNLQNFADNLGLKISEFSENNKRKKNKYILLKNDGLIISPKLNYTAMNHFMLGINNCKKYNL